MTTRPATRLLLRVAAAVAILLPGAAGPLRAGQDGAPGGAAATIVNKADVAAKTGVGTAALSSEEERLIRSYFDVNPDVLGEVTTLSDGVRAKLAPGAPLPLIRIRQALPGDLDAGLAPHQGLDYQVIGSDVVLFDTATRRIVAVLRDVLRDG